MRLSPPPLCGRARRVGITGGLLLGCLAFGQVDFTDSFNSGLESGWSHFDLSVAGLPGGPYGTYTFPEDGKGGRAYRINSYASPDPETYGPGRAFSFRSARYSRAVLQVDVLDWTAMPNVAFGILFRANTIGVGTTSGYILDYLPTDDLFQLNRVASEAAAGTLAQTTIFLDPARFDYRWQLSTWGGTLLGLVYQLPDDRNPVAGLVVEDATTATGVAGLFNFDQDNLNTPGALVASATFDNYSVRVPAAGTLEPVVFELRPTPASGVHEVRPEIRFAVLNREGAVRLDSFALWLDDVPIPSSQWTVTGDVFSPGQVIAFPGATLSYQPAADLPAGPHTVRVEYTEGQGTKRVQQWGFHSEYLRGPARPGAERGFQVRLTQAVQQDRGLGNSLERAFLQLQTNSPIPARYTTRTVASTINFSQRAVLPDAGAEGNFEGDQPFPGQTLDGPSDNYAMEVTCWLDLPAGTTRFGTLSDDGFQITSSALTVNPIVGRMNGSSANEEFSVFVAEPGLYPFRLVWYDNIGGSQLEWFVIGDGGQKFLVNGPGGPAAYLEAAPPGISVLTAPALDASFVPVPEAQVIRQSGVIRIPAPATSPAYFRLGNSMGPISLLQISYADGQIVLRHE